MLYGYIDESGTPGIAINDTDFLTVSLVVIQEPIHTSIISELGRLLDSMRANEIHFTHNSKRTREKIISTIEQLNFEFISITIKKNNLRSHASYANLAKLLSEEIVNRYPNIRIEMDINPKLLEALKNHLKSRKARCTKVKQSRSSSSLGIQLADYVVALSSLKLKHPEQITKYPRLFKKCKAFIQI